MTAQFRRNDEFRLAIAPEGTRGRAAHWKSGFYHLARAADVPLALGFIDYPRREIGVGGYLDLTGDRGGRHGAHSRVLRGQARPASARTRAPVTPARRARPAAMDADGRMPTRPHAAAAIAHAHHHRITRTRSRARRGARCGSALLLTAASPWSRRSAAGSPDRSR